MRVHPTLDDPVVAALSEGVGGPLGRHARPAPVVDARCAWCSLLAAVCVALGMVQKADCFDEAGATGTARYTTCATPTCPTSTPAGASSSWHWPFTDDPQVRARFEVMEYPVGIAYWAFGTA